MYEIFSEEKLKKLIKTTIKENGKENGINLYYKNTWQLTKWKINYRKIVYTLYHRDKEIIEIKLFKNHVYMYHGITYWEANEINRLLKLLNSPYRVKPATIITEGDQID